MTRKIIFLSVLIAIIIFGLALLFLSGSPKTNLVIPRNRNIPPSSAEALSQCDLELQSSVLKTGVDLDWKKLGITNCYQLQLNINPEMLAFQASARVTITNLTGQALSDLVFRLFPNSQLIYGGRIEIAKTKLDDQLVECNYILDRTAIKIIPISPIRPGQTVKVTFEYSLILPDDFGSDRVYGIFNHATIEKVYTFANWFPILAVHNGTQWMASAVDGIGDAVTSQTALFLVDISAPEGWEVATTGMETGVTAASGSVTHHYASGPVRDFMVVASPDFELDSRLVNGVKINQWGLPGTKPGWNRAMEITAASLESFSTQYGVYPYREIDVVATPLNIALGVEYPGLILISQKDYLPGLETENELIVVVAHEVAHQWWYAIVGNDVSAHPWQDEGLTTFSTLEFLRQFNQGIWNYLKNSYQQKVSLYQQSNGVESFAQPVSAFVTKPSAYSTLVYGKAALFFSAMKEKIGDKAFDTALRSYFSANAYQIASPDDLWETFSTACNCDLNTFLESWGVKK